MSKLALLDTDAIPLDLSAAQNKVVVLLKEHSLVTVDDTGGAAVPPTTHCVTP